jgi:hypothetical protein
MVTSVQSIRELLSVQAALSHAEVLQLLKVARDQLLFSAFQGEAVTYIEIRNRRVQVADPEKLLARIERLIPQYESLVQARAGRSARNYAVIRKA